MNSTLTATPDPTVSRFQGAILRALAYFDIFDHPLTLEEIDRFTDLRHEDRTALERDLNALAAKGLVFDLNGYWSLHNKPENVQVRINDEERARTRLPRARKMSELIARFPYIRAVFISGSLSKGRLAEDGDIDFFIVTAPGRLWLARTLLVLYKKIFLLNSRRDFCINYFVDTEHLTIEDKNRFTAMEVVTLLPMYGNGTVDKFYAKNTWAFDHYPRSRPMTSHDLRIGTARSKKRAERLFNGNLGERLDSSAMNLTWRFWKWKFSDLDPQTFDLALRTRTYVSKHHPSNFQKRVLDSFSKRVSTLEQQLKQQLN